MNPENEFETQNTGVEPLDEQQANVPAPGGDIQPVGSAITVTDRKVRGGMFGVPETIGFAFSCLVLLGVIAFYFFAVGPAQSDLKTKKAQRDEQEIKRNNLQAKYQNFSKTEEFVGSLEQSVSDFEFNYLPISSIGKTELYDRLNGLMYAYHLRNTAGPDYVPLEIVAQKGGQPTEERGKNKFQSLFPGIYINMTVEGNYANLRRFIGEIEASRQFVIISTVELQSTESKDEDALKAALATNPQNSFAANNAAGKMGGPVMGPQSQPLKPASPKGKTLGEMVSLHIELAAYFRREAAPGSALAAPAAK
jgi:hypothetical protein